MRSFLSTVLLFSLAVGAGAAPPQAGAETSILAGPDGEAWRALFSTLNGQGAVVATFTERRWFAVRKQPAVLEGEMRMSPQRGLSLHYADKGGRTMIVDAKGILLRDDRGRSKAVPSDSPAAGAGALLLPVLRFDLTELEKQFFITGAREAATWRLELRPRRGDLEKSLRAIVIAGEGERIGRIEIDRGEKQRIEIEIGEVMTGVSFSTEEEKKFFRASP